jgi:coenzyme F420-reducing hydrogenase delta subunit
LRKQIVGAKIIVFTCNWNGYSGLEAAGTQRMEYSSAVYPIRISCLGRLTSGIILRAFEKGASGVILMGCLDGECHYHTGTRQVKDVFQEARKLIRLLGYEDQQLQLVLLPVGDGTAFIKEIHRSVDEIQGLQSDL